MSVNPPVTPTAPAAPSLRQLVQWLLGITKPVHPPLLISLLCRIMNLLLDLALFATAAGGVISLVQTDGNPTGFFIALAVLAIAKASFFYLEQFTGHYVAFKALELLRSYVFAKMWPKAPAIVTSSRSGDLLASLTRDVDRIEVVYAHTFAPVVSAYVVGPAAIIVTGFWVGWGPISIAALCLLLSLVVVPFVGARLALRATRTSLEQRRDLAHHVSDSLYGLNEVLGYGLEAERLTEMDKLGQEVSGTARTARDLTGFRRGANVLLMLVATISVIWLGAGSLSLVALAALSTATLRIFEGPRGVEDATGYLDHSLAAARRLWEISHTPERVSDGPETLELAGPAAFRYEQVSYAYPQLDSAAALTPQTEAVSKITLDLPAGGHTIFVGRSGSGKSTLVQLLQRYDDPSVGQITLNSRPLSAFTLDSLRRQVVAVSQKNQLLQASIAQNLRLGHPDASEEQLWHALTVAGLADEIRDMQDGLDTQAGQNGSALSGGQVQRLSLARALLIQPRVLILDEFSANLNQELEQHIRAQLAQEYPDLTIIEVTHRLRATEQADLIVVLDRGQVVLSGTSAEVTQRTIEELFKQETSPCAELIPS